MLVRPETAKTPVYFTEKSTIDYLYIKIYCTVLLGVHKNPGG